jgi:hypothetical protein
VEISNRPLLIEQSQVIEIETTETGVATATATTFLFGEHHEEIDLKDVIRTIKMRLGVDIKIGTTINMYFYRQVLYSRQEF